MKTSHSKSHDKCDCIDAGHLLGDLSPKDILIVKKLFKSIENKISFLVSSELNKDKKINVAKIVLISLVNVVINQIYTIGSLCTVDNRTLTEKDLHNIGLYFSLFLHDGLNEFIKINPIQHGGIQ